MSAPTLVLDLSFNGLGDKEASYIAVCIKENPMLLSLDLSHNQIGDKGLAVIAEALKSSSICHLRLQRNRIHDRGAKELAKAFVDCSNLTELDLSRNYISDKGVKALLRKTVQLSKTLETLNLSHNRIRNLGAKFIASFLEETVCLSKLFLEANNISGLGIDELEAAIENNNSLLAFEIKGTSVKEQLERNLQQRKKVQITALQLLRTFRVMKYVKPELPHQVLRRIAMFMDEEGLLTEEQVRNIINYLPRPSSDPYTFLQKTGCLKFLRKESTNVECRWKDIHHHSPYFTKRS